MEEIKRQLLEMQDEILNQLATDLEMSRNGIGEDGGDEIDEALEDTYRTFSSLLSRRDQQKLEQIRQALIDIEQKTYGICKNCEEKIPKKRLKVLPFAEYCVACKNEMERTHFVARPFAAESDFAFHEADT